jgi:cellulose biosynthesis protein BcsQ
MDDRFNSGSKKWSKIMTIIVSLFNNKGGVGKTTTVWNLAVSLANKRYRVLVIDFDPQCNLSIAALGSQEFEELLKPQEGREFGSTIRSFVLPFIQQSRQGTPHIAHPKCEEGTRFDLIPGDFWLNAFSDILNVGTDVIGGSGLYRFLMPSLVADAGNGDSGEPYDYVLIDLPPSFGSIVRSALYSSDYFLVPCTADRFSAYCVGLIGEVLPIFADDWDQGLKRYKRTNPNDDYVESKGRPKFGGWIFNGFDTRNKKKLGADQAQFEQVKRSVERHLLARLRNEVKHYDAVPEFVNELPCAEVEDMNVMAPDSLQQNIPIKFLPNVKPTRENYAKGRWAQNQIELMKKIDGEYDNLADYIIKNFT